jgi:hypothetical protein
MVTSFGWDVKPRSSLCHTHSIIHGLKRSRRSCPRRVSAGNKKMLYQACTFPEVGMWPHKRWEIESGHIRISSWVQGERRRRRRRSLQSAARSVITTMVHQSYVSCVVTSVHCHVFHPQNLQTKIKLCQKRHILRVNYSSVQYKKSADVKTMVYMSH